MRHRQIGLKGSKVVNGDGHVIGLDIGATAVRASILAQGTVDGRPSVTTHGAGSVSLHPGVVVNGVVQEPAALTAALKQLWQANKFECRSVVLGVANPQVLVRDITVPDLNQAQRAKALPYQAREVVALPMEQVVLDFCQLGEPAPDTNMVNGLLLAVPREPVLAAVRAVEKAKLHVARVDLSAFGIMRSVAGELAAPEAIVDIGAQLTTVVIHDRGLPRLVRTLVRGGEQVTAEVADRLGTPLWDVEAHKREQGLHSDQFEFHQALMDGLRPLLAEIRTSIQYYRSANGGGLLERVTITGGGAELRGLAELLSEQLGLPVHRVDPLQHARNRHSSKQGRQDDLPHTTSAVAVGLAMGAAA